MVFQRNRLSNYARWWKYTRRICNFLRISNSIEGTSQVCAGVDEELDEVEVAAGGGGVERGPLLGVGGVGVAAVRDEQLHHLLAVVDAALKMYQFG